MAETKSDEFFDDSSSALGLDHSPDAGKTRLDGRGRTVIVIPDAANEKGYSPELVGKNPEEMAEIIGARDDHDVCDDTACSRCNNVDDRLVSEAPGTIVGHGGGSSGRKHKKPVPGFDRTKQNVIDIEMKDLRPIMVGGRISVEANRAIYTKGNPSIGEILEYVGRAMARGVSWTQISNSIQLLTLAE